MKKWLSLLLASVMVFTLSACSGAMLGGDGGKPALSRGQIEGDVYTNNYLCFQFTKPQSWVYSTDEEIADLLNTSVENLLGDKFKEALENSESIYDMMVVDTLSGANVNVTYENLAKSLATNITIEQYIASLKEQVKNIPSITVVFPDKYDTVKLGDSEFTRVACTTTMYGITMKQIYYLRKVDKYMAVVVVTAQGSYSMADIEAMFSKIA